MFKPFLYIPDIEFSKEELTHILESECEWIDFGKKEKLDNSSVADVGLPNKYVPYSIRKFFNFTDPFITSGFVRINPGYNLKPHDDRQKAESVINAPEILSKLPKYYGEWLKIVSDRDWAISFPVSGDFTNIQTSMYRADNGHYAGGFCLNISPVLYCTGGAYTHGVDNTASTQPRILFQLSFKGHDIYESLERKYDLGS